MEQIFFRMHVRVSRILMRLAGGKTRIALETTLFVLAVGLLCLVTTLHRTFMSGHDQAGCLRQFMPTTMPHLLHIQVEPDKASWLSLSGLFTDNAPRAAPRNAYVYAMQKGLLTMVEYPDEMPALQIAHVSVPMSSECFGLPYVGTSSAWMLFLDKVLGFDTILINNMIEITDGGKGYLYNELTKDTYNLNYASEFRATTSTWYSLAAYKLGIFCTVLFLFFSTTTLVSFILRETQQRMLKFTILLQQHIRHRLPYTKLVLSHIIESLVFVPIMVGMLFFLFEFFKDQLLAFIVMSLAWLCELYSVVCVRTWLSLTFFPPLFLLYFSMFHVYFFCFPFGFSYTALWTTIVFLIHTMLLFLNRFEIPALNDGLISTQTPRQFVLAPAL
ncbi:hypothetical protein SDRG_09595 [Saprolegnia diclina VS20]|uniref:Membralin n=1 Tax=Saprolegnia diclina (strain VS20) TaxID=1156394 RepID=T0QEB2_SAPDV|nr:hypothetical protein SDRG_09595 [Saprolegnia diclina VS20]EQC33076.1 hypothetical protein SDRG_09595 [Saprolegnia diclina VS20]|eukprot:XP_008613762.1 hypothetical protein SDRG_09595 [Saprolegnia diclina VS20]